MALDFECHSPTVTDIDHACVFANAHEKLRPAFGRLLFSELTQVHLGGFIGAVLTPHNAVHSQLTRRGSAAKDLANALVFVGLKAEFGEGLRRFRMRCSAADGVETHDGPIGWRAVK